MVEYTDKKEAFEFEKKINFLKPELWENEALELFASAQILMGFYDIQIMSTTHNETKLSDLFSEEISNISFINYNIIRMLWGYGFENILKGIIVKKRKRVTPTLQTVPIGEIKTHNLLSLFEKADINLTEEHEFYIKAIEKCSIWMGRYPLPVKSNQMYEQRKPMNSRNELFERKKGLREKFINGEIPRIICESDILNGGVDIKELEIINELITITKKEFNK